jgi:hypothetical protein
VGEPAWSETRDVAWAESKDGKVDPTTDPDVLANVECKAEVLSKGDEADALFRPDIRETVSVESTLGKCP